MSRRKCWWTAGLFALAIWVNLPRFNGWKGSVTLGFPYPFYNSWSSSPFRWDVLLMDLLFWGIVIVAVPWVIGWFYRPQVKESIANRRVLAEGQIQRSLGHRPRV